MGDPTNAPLPRPRMEGPELELDRQIDEYETYFKDLRQHACDMTAWVARYSRGDDLALLREAFLDLAANVRREQQASIERYGKEHPRFRSLNDDGQPAYVGLYRDGLALLGIALCLGVRGEPALSLLDACSRGDTLIELLRGQLVARRASATKDCFPQHFGGLYAASAAPAEERAARVAGYLADWCDVYMDGFGFKAQHERVGYWCFEAAGVVAALDIDDRSFAEHRHYPADLVRFYRDNRPPALPVAADEAVALPPPPPIVMTAWPATQYGLDPVALRRLLTLVANDAERPIAAAWDALVLSVTDSATDPADVDEARAQRWALGAAIHALGNARGAIVLDWKASDQVAPACRALEGLDFVASFRWRAGKDEGVLEGLGAFGRHAAAHGYTLVHLESMSDAYWATVTPNERLPELMALAKKLGLGVRVG